MGLTGAILGDIAGSLFEFKGDDWDEFLKTDYDLFFDNKTKRAPFTDDTVLSLATKDAILTDFNFIRAYKSFACKNRFAGYGGKFACWMNQKNPKPYNSWGNGSAMRASFCGEATSSLEDAENLGVSSSAVTHNHPEGLKGAKVLAGCVFMAENGYTKDQILEYGIKHYPESYPNCPQKPLSEYDDKTLSTFDVSCQGSVPMAIRIFYEFDDFSKMMRWINRQGIDTDTIGAIAGAIFHSYYHKCIDPETDDKVICDRLKDNKLLMETYRMEYDKNELADKIRSHFKENPLSVEEPIEPPSDEIRVGWSCGSSADKPKNFLQKLFRR